MGIKRYLYSPSFYNGNHWIQSDEDEDASEDQV